MRGETEKITIRLPTKFMKTIDFLVVADDFSSRSEAIRAAIRDFIYARVELVQEKIEKFEKAQRALADIERVRKEYMNR